MNVVFDGGEGGSEIKKHCPWHSGNGLELETSLWTDL